MASIQNFLDKISAARFGKDVRSSIVNAIDAVNKESETSVKKVNQAEANVNKAVVDATNATNAANTAASSAITAANNANEAAQAIFDEKYILTARTEFNRSASVSPTAKGNAILEKLKGDSWQRTLSGKNKLPNNLETQTVNNAVFTVNKDGSVSLSGTPTKVTTLDMYGTYSTPISFPSGNYIASGGISNILYLRVRIYNADGTFNRAIGADATERSFTIAEGELVNVALYVNTTNAISGTFYPMIRLATVTDATYEPNPEYPQTIHSVGDMGWFDGELRQGKYDEGGNYMAGDSASVCNITSIPCKGGDLIAILHDVNATPLIYWRGDNGFISGQSALDEVTAPSDATHFDFILYSSAGITPSTVGHVCVTINGKYALIVDEVGKNLMWFDQSYNNYTSRFNYSSNVAENITGVAVENGVEEFIATFRANLTKGVTYKILGEFTNITRVYLYKSKTWLGTPIHNFAWLTTHEFVYNGESGEVTIAFYAKRDTTVTTKVINAMLVEQSGVGNAYQPHQSTRHYIPLDEPLRGIGDVKDEVKCVDGLYGDYHNTTELIVDGTQEILLNETLENTVRWQINWTNVQSYVNSTAKSFCDKLKFKASWTSDDEHYYQNGTHIFVYLSKDKGTTLEEIKEYFAENPYTFVGLLKKPTFTPFADQIPFYNLEAYDEVTHVSIVGCHEELNPIATMRFPRNEEGALVTTNWCDNKKNEIRMDELTAAMLALSQE